MRPTRGKTAILIAFAFAACDEGTPTTVEVAPYDDTSATELALVIPEITSADLVVFTEEVSDPGADGPARAFRDPGTDPEPYPDPPPQPMVSDIWDTWSSAGFDASGFAWGRGSHRYQGNKGRIETTAFVNFEGQRIGSQTGIDENYNHILLDFGVPHYITTRVQVYTGQTCGLAVWAHSVHMAWWELLEESQALGRSTATSDSAVRSQGACAPPPPSGGGGGTSIEDEQVGSQTCYFWIQYDLETGEILDSRYLFCEPTEGG